MLWQPPYTRELRRRGPRVNRKKVQRLMRADNLLCLRKRRFVVTTEWPGHCALLLQSRLQPAPVYSH